ncbi:MAG TPA: mannitol dehydrogenase family protein [Roseiarcus sp.]|nr:mannitol dehydrogenase family protein [Roseiarcus sp.]
MSFPILQFGTSRFLQAHVDLFVAQGFVEGDGTRKIAVVQTTASADSARRLAFFNSGRPYRVHVRGLAEDAVADEWIEVASIGRGVDANSDWGALETLFVEDARWIVSNTGDRGYELNSGDRFEGAIPRSFPAKLTKLLHARFAAGRPAPTLFPCELVEANGDQLRALVLEVARGWNLTEDFQRWTADECLWINSLVDRIVSEPLEPAGAVAEPYALWAVENRPGLVMPCRHPSVVITGDLKPYARLKLFILNLGHSYLAEGWAARGGARSETVRALLADAAVLNDLNDLYDREVLPVFDAIGLGAEARAYRASVIERFRNPFLDHYLADIFTNHAAKKQRRFAGLIALGAQAGVAMAQPRLRAALAH